MPVLSIPYRGIKRCTLCIFYKYKLPSKPPKLMCVLQVPNTWPSHVHYITTHRPTRKQPTSGLTTPRGLLAKNREALVLYVVSLTLYSTLYSTSYYLTNSIPSTYHTFHILYPFYFIRTRVATTQWSLHAVQSSVLRLQLSPSVPLPLPGSLSSSSVADSSLPVAAMNTGLHPATYLGKFMFLLPSNSTWFSNYVWL